MTSEQYAQLLKCDGLIKRLRSHKNGMPELVIAKRFKSPITPKAESCDNLSFVEKFHLQGGKCYLCGCQMTLNGNGKAKATREHVTPKSQGGKLTKIACLWCNGIKGNMSLEQFVLKFGKQHPWNKCITTHTTLIVRKG